MKWWVKTCKTPALISGFKEFRLKFVGDLINLFDSNECMRLTKYVM